MNYCNIIILDNISTLYNMIPNPHETKIKNFLFFSGGGGGVVATVKCHLLTL